MINRKKDFKSTKMIKRSDTTSVRFNNDSPIIQSEFYQGKPKRYSKRVLNIINNMSKKMTKSASSAGCSVRGDSMMSSSMFYHPEYEPSSLLMPRDPIEINAWSRYFYKYDALVSTSIDAHAELPISTIRLTMPKSSSRKKNVAIKEEYEEMCSTEYLDLFNKLLQIGVEYYKIGNIFPFAQWSEDKRKWVKLTILDPDYVEIDKLQFSDKMRVDLRPNDRLKEVVNNGPNHPKTGLLYQAIPEDVRELIQTGKKIPLNTNPDNGSHVAHIAYKMADYDTLGTGLIERNFKPLVYKDRLRQSQDAIAARHLTPKHLIWAEVTSNADVDAIREQVDNSFADPDYAIITNYELHWELIGTSTGLMSLDSEWSWINEELMIGLMINRSFLLGEGAFANGQTVLEVMNQRYSIYRERLESYIIHYLFLPMAKRNDWVEYAPGTIKKEKKKIYLYPKIKWNRLNFVDDTAHKQMLSQMVNQGQVDMETWLESFGLDAETIKDRLIRYEGTPLDVNHFEENRSIASEVGRVLAPAIAKIRAEQRGVELPKSEGDNQFFGSKDKKIEKKSIKQIKNLFESAEKIAETRDQRKHDREIQKLRHEVKNKNDELEVPLEKRKKPERKDMKKPKLFENSNNGYDEVPVLNSDKCEKMIREVRKSESEKEKWIDQMINLGISQNSRRTALILENELLSLNGGNKGNIILKYLPQIFAYKIDGVETLMKKTELAKEKFKHEINNIGNKIGIKLEKTNSSKEIKLIVRNSIKEIFENDY